MKITIGRKIAFPFFVMFILIVGMAGITYQGFNKVNNSLDNMQLEAVKRGSAGNLRFNITQLLMACNDHVITQNRYYQREFDRLNLVVDNYYHEFNRLSLTDEEQLLLEHIKQDLDSIRTISAQIFSIPNPRQSPKAWKLMETMDYRFGEEVNLRSTQIFDGISRRIEAHNIQADTVQENVKNFINTVTLISLILTIVISYLTIYRISKPIIIVAKAADGIANGDYSHRAVVKTHDEIALLAKSFNVMAESIQQSQSALEESKKLTEAIVATVPIGLLVFDSNGKILSVNNSFCDIFGLNYNDLVGQKIEPMFDKLNIQEECRNHILTRNPVTDIECNYSDPVKGLRIMNLTLFPIKLTDGESLLIIEDITKRKHDEQVVSNSEKHFRALIENSTDGLIVVSPDGFLLYESPANNRITGFAHNELLNRNIFEFVHPDDLLSVKEQLKELLRQPNSFKSTEFRIQHKDGTWRWVDVTAKNSLDNTTIGGIVINFHDVTERKRVEEELLKISTAAEQTADCVVITDRDGIIQYVNMAFTKIFGYSKEEALGRTPRILKSGLHPEEFYKTLWKTIQSGKVFTETFINKRKDGELIYEIKTITPIKDKEGNITHFVSTAKEITEQRRAEEALFENEKRLKEAQRLAHLGSWELDLRNNKLRWSDEIYRIFELQSESFDATYEAFLDVIHPDDREFVNQAYTSSVTNRKVYSIDHRLLMKDGRIKYVHEQGETYYDEKGNPVRSIGTVQDITDRKLAEEKLRQGEERYRSTLDDLLEGCQIIGHDWRYLYLNDAADNHNHRPKEELLGKKYMNIWPGIEETKIFSIIKRSMEERVSHQLENEFTFPDGTKGWFKLSIEPVPEGILILSEDINDRKRVEEVLRESEAKFRKLISSLPDAVLVVDTEGRIVYCNQNATKIFAYKLDEMLSCTIEDLLPKRFSEHHLSLRNGYLSEPKSRAMGEGRELFALRKDGSEFSTEIMLEPVEINSNLFILTIVRDITERKKAEEEIFKLNTELEQRVIERTSQLETANKELEAFSYSVSHDLRAPLRAIDGFSKIIMEDYEAKLDDEGKRFLKMIRTNTQQMDHLITDLLSLSRVSRIEINFSSIDMTALVNSIYNEITSTKERKKFVFTVAELPNAIGDTTLMKQVWSNLLSNAVKFTLPKNNRKIEIGSYQEKGKNIYFVKDSGAGFNPNYVHKLFGLFQRLHKTDEFEGTGVGLAIVQRIIHRHGGEVWAEGKINEGATFYFSLPNSKSQLSKGV